MFQLPVNNLTRIRKARKQVKRALGDIGLDFCKEAAEDFKEFCPNEQLVKNTYCLDICGWDPSYSKSQAYRSKPFCCTECQFSSKYYSGYKNHFRSVHSKTFDSRTLIHCPYCTFIASKRVVETHVKLFHVAGATRPNYNNLQATQLANKGRLEKSKQAELGGKPVYFCKKCTFRDALYNVVRRHIYREHFQHVVTPYLGMVSDSSKNGSNAFTGNNIFCKHCQFTTRSYEVLVQHVVEYHERIGVQVTNMIGHAKIVGSKSLANAVMYQNAKMGPSYRQDGTAQPAIGYLKPLAPTVKIRTGAAASQVRITLPFNSMAGDKTAGGTNTAQTQKWKICTVCNELFPENLYAAHFESAHKARKVWATAKYIMKIHNFTSKCFHCNRYLPSDTLLNHMLIHGLTCPQCQSTFHTVEKITEHAAEAHSDEFVTPPGVTPLTFDLTIKKDKPYNIQLAVLTFNMKEPVNGQNQSKSAHRLSSPLVNLMASRGVDKIGVSTGQNLAPINAKGEVVKTVCPLCFTILKGSLTNGLAMHLRERHQVLQTLHPVEKKMTYKCIHCLGVYTSNMVASTITLHLVQCRAVGRSQSGLGFKSALTLNSSGAGFLKRQLPWEPSAENKKMRLTKGSEGVTSAESGELALDPRSYEHKTYEARKNFLTAYFNRRPYISTQEEENLSSSLWLWKSDISNHFDSNRKVCVSSCETNKMQVLLGFDMQALKKVKHDMNFVENKANASTRRIGRLKASAIQIKKDKAALALKLSVCTETISIDSDDEPEPNPPAEHGDIATNHVKEAQREEAINLTEESGEKETDISDESNKEKEINLESEKCESGENDLEISDESTKEKEIHLENEKCESGENEMEISDESKNEKEINLESEKFESVENETEKSDETTKEKEIHLENEKTENCESLD